MAERESLVNRKRRTAWGVVAVVAAVTAFTVYVFNQGGRGLAVSHLHALAVDGQRGVLLAGAHEGLFAGRDYGARWELVQGTRSRDFMQLAAVDTVLLAAGHDMAVVRSDDGGRNWRPSGQGLPGTDVHALAVAPDGRALAFVVGHGLFASADRANTWRAVNPGVKDENLTAVLLVPGDAAAALAGSPRGLLVSADGGRTMAALPGAPAAAVTSLAAAADGTLWAASSAGLFRSADGGRTWRAAPPGPFGRDAVAALAADPADPRRLFAASAEGRFAASSDGGGTWRALD